jgi:hypothetical protein
MEPGGPGSKTRAAALALRFQARATSGTTRPPAVGWQEWGPGLRVWPRGLPHGRAAEGEARGPVMCPVPGRMVRAASSRTGRRGYVCARPPLSHDKFGASQAGLAGTVSGHWQRTLHVTFTWPASGFHGGVLGWCGSPGRRREALRPGVRPRPARRGSRGAPLPPAPPAWPVHWPPRRRRIASAISPGDMPSSCRCRCCPPSRLAAGGPGRLPR